MKKTVLLIVAVIMVGAANAQKLFKHYHVRRYVGITTCGLSYVY